MKYFLVVKEASELESFAKKVEISEEVVKSISSGQITWAFKDRNSKVRCIIPVMFVLNYDVSLGEDSLEIDLEAVLGEEMTTQRVLTHIKYKERM